MIEKLIELALTFIGCGYWWGAKGVPGTQAELDKLIKQYGRDKYINNSYDARKWLGKPYNFDCSGLITYCLIKLGLIKGHINAASIFSILCIPIAKDKLQRGDLAFRVGTNGVINHVGIYLGNNRVLHARGTFYGTVETSLFDSFTVFGKLKVFEGDGNNMSDIEKIKDFQKRNDLVPDGIPGPLTKAKANEVLEVCNLIFNYREAVKPTQKTYKKVSITGKTDYSTIKRGSKGQDVVVLQEQIKEMGFYTGKIDGDFGPKTDDAVRYVQKINGLVVDGIVGAKTWENILVAHVYEVDPVSLKNEIVASKGTSIKGDFINSIFFDMVEFKPLGNMVNEGQLLAKQKIYNEQGKQHDYVKRGNLIVYKDGSVAVKMIMDIEKEEDLSKIRFAVSGFNMEPLSLKDEWQPESVGRTTWRSMLGYNKSTGKINAVVMANCSAVRGKKILDKQGCNLKLGLDSGDSTNARFGKDIRLTSRKLYGIIKFE